jgi:acyl transferase domain-containing protein/acyl-CoA synthetase (AMP-forming)/AMP-acid ligase II/acetylornithine/succinyldiaminopimelate/putrescine aminotransferase/acyl carrier protein
MVLPGEPLSHASTFVETLRFRAAQQSEQIAYTFLLDGETESGHLTYRTLDRQSRAIAATLQSEQSRGERVLLLYSPGLDFIAALFGCFYAGAIAVPAHPPISKQYLQRVLNIIDDAQPQLVLTTQAHLPKIKSLLAEASTSNQLRWLATDDISVDFAGDWQETLVGGEDLALLQYTSGSTAVPKGVMISHGNLSHNSSLSYQRFQHTDESRGVCWLPPYHDMGLVGGILQPLFGGFPMWLMSPVAFLKNPFRWLDALSRYQATTSGGPNFAYDLCTQRISAEQRATLDLSSWEVAINGAEQVRAGTLERFAEYFKAQGFRRRVFYPCYGLAESTLFVAGGTYNGEQSVCDVDAPALEQNVISPATGDGTHKRRSIVSCGLASATHEIMIVDPETGEVGTSDRVGEIWLSSLSVAQGYWNKPEETAQTFRAVSSAGGDRTYLRTGDLGFLKDGELFVTGRIKDLILIHGHNHYPQDIELTVEKSHPALQSNGGAAFSVEIGDEERLVIVQEVGRRSRIDGRAADEATAVLAAIHRAVQEQHELAAHAIVLIKYGSLPRTPSGKVQRHVCRARFQRGELSILAERRADEYPGGDTEAITGEDGGRTGMPRASVAKAEPLHPPLIDFKRALFATSGEETSADDLRSLLKSEADGGAAGARPNAPQTDSRTETIAIVGMGCRFPGAENPEAFWRLLRDKVDAITEVPPDRWDIDDLYDPIAGAPGKMNSRWGGFLNRVDLFDPHFFDISPREAVRMDPQQRLLLEVTWEAFEHAGLPVEKLAGTETGVFIGIGSVDYSQLQIVSEGHETKIDAYCGTGNAHSIAANRLSYLFDFRGPSLAVDTACSSSLVAVHLACESLRRGECSAALAAGVNIILSPIVSIAFSQARMLSSDGRCKTFDARADGYVRSEGCGALVLKRLSDALRDGDQILGMIRGSAINQDGRTGGITAPNSKAQQAVIRQALAQAKISPEQISYIEAHGTGTTLGDFIELQALATVFPAPQAPEHRCLLGSVKANIGHLETASGIAGLIKVLLCFEHEEIPAQLHLTKPNPHIDLSGTPLSIPTEKQAWVANGTRRLAGVSSFGFGGTNAHVVLEEPPPSVPARQRQQSERPLHLLTLSAKNDEGLKRVASRMADSLATETRAGVADTCYTANTGRTHFLHRLAVIGQSDEELAGKLREFALEGSTPSGLFQGQTSRPNRARIAFLFTGQGSQYAGMGLQLYATQPTFRRAFDTCLDILNLRLERPLLAVLDPESKDAALLNETGYTQPLLFALEYALAELWRSWGIEPDVVLGHSVGEYVAACVAGVFSLEDGLKLISERARLMQELPRDGAMASVFADETKVAALVSDYDGLLSIAAVNAPGHVVIAGHSEAVAEAISKLREMEVNASLLQVSHAFHSSLMEPILDVFERAASGVKFNPPQKALVSNVTGQLFAAGSAPDARYWRDHVRQAVRFEAGVKTLVEQEVEIFVEIGPHPVLLGLARRCVPSGRGMWLPSLKRGQDEWQVLLHSLGEAYTKGSAIDWQGFDRDYRRQLVPLPTYPFARERFWYSASQNEDASAAKQTDDRAQRSANPLLGKRKLNSALPTFEVRLDSPHLQFLKDHRVQELTPVPATSYLEMALAVAAESDGRDAQVILQEVKFHKMLLWREQESQKVQVVLFPEAEGGSVFQIYSQPSAAEQSGAAWVLHATGQVKYKRQAPQSPAQESVEEILRRCAQQFAGEQLYFEFDERGLQYGPSFRMVERVWRRDGEAIGSLKTPDPLKAQLDLFQLHPAILDASFHVLGAAMPEQSATDSGDSAFVPVGVDELRVFSRPGGRLWSHAVLRGDPQLRGNLVEGDVRLLDEQGSVIAEVIGLRLQRLPIQMGKSAEQNAARWLQRVEWIAQALPDAEPQSGDEAARQAKRWLIFADRQGVGKALAERLVGRGDSCVLVSPGATLKRTHKQPRREYFKLNPARREEMVELLRLATRAEQQSFDAVIHLWSLNAPPTTKAQGSDFQTAHTLGCHTVLHLVQALSETSEGGKSPQLWLVTSGAQAVHLDAKTWSIAQSPLIGLGRVIAREHPELRCSSVDLHSTSVSPDELSQLFRELLAGQAEDQLVFRDGQRFVARLVPQQEQEAEAAPSLAGPQVAQEKVTVERDELLRLGITGAGSLDNVALRPARRHVLEAGQVEIEVRASGLNFRDIMKTLGIYPSAPGAPSWLGDECAGVLVGCGEGVRGLEVGQEVLAVAPASFSTFAYTSSRFVVPKPAHLSMQEAAAIPIAFTTAYHALVNLGKLSKGERVLIHAGAGGVGLAALQVARMLGAEVFATAGSNEKREYLQSLGVEHVMDSRTLDFADEIMEITSGEGVDVVLNSLAGEAIARSLATLKPFGRFLEIGKRDIYENSKLGLRPFQNNLTFFAIDMERVFREQPDFASTLLQDVVRHLAAETFRPLPVREFPIVEASDAFHYMAQRKNIGKVVLSMAGLEAFVSPLPEKAQTRTAANAERLATSSGEHAAGHPLRFHPEGSYLITGGTGDLGLLLARWMVIKGAKHVVLVGRRAPLRSVRQLLDEMNEAGADVTFAQADVADSEAMARVLEQVDASGHPLRGVVHAAGMIDDGRLLDLTAERFEAVSHPKIDGAWNLHQMTADRRLDFFVCFSSVASILGSPGQANYAAANAFLDALGHYRRSLGLPSLTINWGPWAEVGMAARTRQNDRFSLVGIDLIAPGQGLKILKHLLQQHEPQVMVMSADWQRLSRALAPSASAPPLFATLIERQASDGRGRGIVKAGNVEIIKKISAATPERRQAILESYFQTQFAKVTGIELSRIDSQQPLTSFGFDSLMALELMYSIEAGLGVKLPMESLSQEMSIAQLVAQALPLLEEMTHASGSGDTSEEPKDETIAVVAEQVMTVVAEQATNESLIANGQPLESPATTRPVEKINAPTRAADLLESSETVRQAPLHVASALDAASYGRYVRPRFAQALGALKLDVSYVWAAGDHLVYEDAGRRVEVLDMLGGYGSTLFGHNHPEIVAYARELLASEIPVQAQWSIRHASGRLARALSEKLKTYTGQDYIAVFANSGAEAIEAALKHAVIEYVARIERREANDKRGFALFSHQRRNGSSILSEALVPKLQQILGKRTVPRDLASVQEELMALNDTVYQSPPLFLALERSFHGKTLGALSLTANADYREAFSQLGGLRVEWLKPGDSQSLREIVNAETRSTYALQENRQGQIELVERQWCNIVAAFLEPVQGEGGIHVIDSEFLNHLQEAAQRNGFPLVVDEVQTGMGRAGSFLASQRQNMRGHYYTLAKSLGGGVAKVGVLLIERERYELDFGLIHTSTFAEDDFSSMIALKTLEILERDDLAGKCEAKGAYLLERLRELQRRYPSVIGDVRGMGLLIGIELAPQTDSPSKLIRLSSEQKILAFISAGYLLNEEQIRIGTTMSSPNTLRLEPSAYISRQSMERVIEALERLCRIIEHANAGRLVRYLAETESPDATDPIRDWRGSSVPEYREEISSSSGGAEVAFFGHFIDESHLIRWDASLAEIPAANRLNFLRRIHRVVKPAVTRRARIRSASGEIVTLRMISWMTTSALLEEAFRSGDTGWIVEQIDEAVEQARREGCQVVGFGGYISIISQNCKKAATTGISLTTGNAFTVGMGVEALRRAAREQRIDLSTSRLGAVGAGGNICSTYLRIMAEEVPHLKLVGRAQSRARLVEVAAALYEDAWARICNEPPESLKGLSRAIYSTRAIESLLAMESRPDAPGEWIYQQLLEECGDSRFVQITDELSTLSECDIIVTASNAASPIIFPEHLSPRPVIICDISVPADVSPTVTEKRPDVIILRGGVVRLPDNDDLVMNEVQLPPGHLFACMAETTLLGLERYKRHFSFGEISKSDVQWIVEAGRRHGYKLGYLMSEGSFL